MRQISRRPEDTDAVEAKVALARIIVDETDRRVAEGPVLQDLLDDQLSRVSGPDDEDLLAARDKAAPARTLDQRPREQARARDEGEQEQGVDQEDGARQ